MTEYFIPAGAGESEYIEKRSQFLGHIRGVESEEEAKAFIAEMKMTYYDARHNCSCYLLRSGIERYSDDGEPHGTAGMPVLDSIRKAGITDAAVVVTRYFGGILLGTGGLVRAYTAAASGAVKEAGIAEVSEFSIIEIKANYSDYQKIMPIVSAYGAKVDDSDFGSEVVMSVSVRVEQTEKFLSELVETTNGRVIAKKVGEKSDFI